MRRKVEGLIPCPYVGRCIHRTEKGGCIALNDANFPGECHFRKETYDGPFVVDAEKGRSEPWNTKALKY